MSLQENIKNLRMKSLLSQEEFAKILGVSVGTINRWENGKTLPNLSAMKKLKKYCFEYKFSFENIENEWVDLRSTEHN